MHSKRLVTLTCAALFSCCVLGLSSAAASAATLSGAGSTLIAPIEAEWAAAWDNATGNTVTYASVGSGTGYNAALLASLAQTIPVARVFVPWESPPAPELGDALLEELRSLTAV